MILYQVAKRLESRDDAHPSAPHKGVADEWLRELIAAGNRGTTVMDIRDGEAKTGPDPLI